METLPVPSSLSLFNVVPAVYQSVVATSGSTILAGFVVTVLVVGVAAFLWLVGNWLYSLWNGTPMFE